MQETTSSRFKRKNDFVFRRVADEAVLVPIRNGIGELGSIFTLNEVGVDIWNLVAEEKTAFEIAREIASRFEVTQEDALRDALAFLGLLEEKQLVERYAADGSATGDGHGSLPAH